LVFSAFINKVHPCGSETDPPTVFCAIARDPTCLNLRLRRGQAVVFAFPLFGMIFVIGGIVSSISSYNKAGDYRRAQQRYRQRREEIRSRAR